MESTKQRMEEIKQQQWKRFQEDSQATTESSPIHAKSPYIMVLGGVAAGLIIATIVWLMVPIMTTEDINTISPESAEAIQPSELKKTNDNIAYLNERMESLTDTVFRLEANLMRVMELTDTITNTENKHASPSQQDIPASEDAKPTLDLADSNASGVVQMTPDTEMSFVPTHTVKDRINLRPSSSLNSTPIAVLEVGSEVEYISEADGWYYVNTQFHGKGWCSSDYLSPLLPTHQKTSAN